MMLPRSRTSASAFAAAFLLLAVTARAGSERPRFSAGTDVVVLSATALDRHGRPVTNLRPDELRVLEDGRPQRLEHFSGAATVPARTLLLVDESGSMGSARKTTSTTMAVTQLLAGLQPQDEVALAGFDHRYWGIVP